MVLWFGPQVFENTLFPKPLHMIPILNHTMFDRIVQAIGSNISFIPMQGIYSAYLELATASSPI